MTTEEIKNALTLCASSFTACAQCPYKYTINCLQSLHRDALDLIDGKTQSQPRAYWIVRKNLVAYPAETPPLYECSNCGMRIGSHSYYNFCPCHYLFYNLQ